MWPRALNTQAFLKQFSDCKLKRRSSKENLVILLAVKVSGVEAES